MKTYLFKRTFFILILILLNLSGITQNKKTAKGMEQMWGKPNVLKDISRTERSKLFDEGNFGMFIHWGLYSQLGGIWKEKTYYGIGEWIMNPRMAKIPVNEYKEIAKKFNPVEFDARIIAKLAKDAGMKYIIITSKHHDGFAMFDSEADAFNIVDATPFARDPMKELSMACKEFGLGFGFYYSHNQDWTTPGGSGGTTEFENGKSALFEDYFYKKCLPQVREICSNYGQIDFVWFDTPGDIKKELIVELVDVVRELQPNAMLCSRVGHGMGDYSSQGDMEIPIRNLPGLWETCDTNNDSWSYAWYDNNFKSPKEILKRLITTVARGGSFLLNVGPNGDGVVPETGRIFLQDAGNWVQNYQRVIYGAGSSPWGHSMPWGDITSNGNSLFLSIFNWPSDGKLYLPGLNAKILKAEIINRKGNLEISSTQEKGWTIFDVPCNVEDPLVPVIEVILEDYSELEHICTTHGILPNIGTTLLTDFAEVTGAKKEKIRWMEKFGEWKHVNQVSSWNENGKCVWNVDVFEPGYYYLDLRYKGVGKLVWSTVTDEGVKVQNQQPATSQFQNYRMGILQFKNAGSHTIEVKLVEGDNSTGLESVLISPIK